MLGFYTVTWEFSYTTWETDILSDVGVDATIDHFTLTADWFNKKVSGLLFVGPLPNTGGGAAAPYVNFGDIQSTGVDFSLNYHDQVSHDFNFDLTLTGTPLCK